MGAGLIDVRPATEADLPLLPEIERAADGIFADVGIVGLPPVADEKEYAGAAAVLVAGTPPVGFARIELVAGEAYLDQLSVHPASMRRGIGAALLAASVEWARMHGHDSLLLATFRDVPWNAPFYARHGFVEVPADTLAARQVADHERELGMPSFGARVLMRRQTRT